MKIPTSFRAISLQRKLLLFVIVTLSLIFALSGLYIYNLVNDTFMESEKKHLKIISEQLSSKVGIWYFINKDSPSMEMDVFLHKMMISYNLEYIAFSDHNGSIISEVHTAGYTVNDPYNIRAHTTVYSPESVDHYREQGILEIAYNHHVLKTLSAKFYWGGVLLVVLLALYFFLEMRLLKELLTPLKNIASEIKTYVPGKKLTFEPTTDNKEDVISEIITGFLHMQQNIDDAMRKKEIEKENNRIKDSILLKQSRFIEMGTMINNIAHQWKQPLNIIELCITDLTIKSMMGTVEKTYQEKIFNDMHIQVMYMSKTIDIFKNFLNDESHKNKMEEFSIQKSIEETLQLLGSTLEKKKIALELDTYRSSNAYGPMNELEQALLIIINNAIDANSTKIYIECTVQNNQNVIKIYDNGGGFDPEVIDNVFDAYFTTKHQSQGTGLGLFIAKMIVEMKFNGRIEALNEKKGALLIIRLPLPPR